MKPTILSRIVLGAAALCAMLKQVSMSDITKTKQQQARVFNITKMPYGVKMCEQFCLIAGCSQRFSYPDLACHATFDNLTEQARKYVDVALYHFDGQHVSDYAYRLTFSLTLSLYTRNIEKGRTILLRQ